jgi:GntR family transcriptional regulator
VGTSLREQEIDRRREAFARARRARGQAPEPWTTSRRAYEILRASLRSGFVEQDERLVENLLVESLGASRNSVRKALAVLAEEGLVSRHPKTGTSVARAVLDIPAGEVMPAEVFATDGAARIRIQELEYRIAPPVPLVRERLATDDDVYMTEQLFTFDDEPLFLRTSYMALDVEREQFLRTMAEVDRCPPPYAVAFERIFGAPFGSSESVVEAVPCEERTAELLGLAKGSPVLLREVLVRDVDGRPRDVSYTHFRGDRVALSSQATNLADGTSRLLRPGRLRVA